MLGAPFLIYQIFGAFARAVKLRFRYVIEYTLLWTADIFFILMFRTRVFGYKYKRTHIPLT
ncbi:hypothetical protein DW091_07950 [Eubacterium sp. AM05-23]|uniref:Uncharacterized protein n=1 Tax=Eubacterium maltosivorans TaxID=2041044 RepID=A0A4P9C6L0_EUBML|nr:hypothetical protein CPZ25_002985 [Eubacterium maltosivorans]RHO58778.1 hypothetical protein DW091_07950 [Eubacterium sp. AM05-23]